MTETKSIQQRMMEELNLPAEDFARHCSDLSVVAHAEVIDWVKANLPNIRYSYFVSPAGSGWNGAGKICLDLQFAEMDQWERIQRYGTEASMIAAVHLSANPL